LSVENIADGAKTSVEHFSLPRGAAGKMIGHKGEAIK